MVGTLIKYQTTLKTTFLLVATLLVLLYGYLETYAQEPTGVDLIRNGSFEERRDPSNGVAAEWEPYSNGEAEFGWYDEMWPEAVRFGDYSQLLEIDDVYSDVQDRVIAIHQTIDVAPNADYALTINAIMRTERRLEERNDSDFEMQWGVDPLGEGNIENVERWVIMPLTEQNRIGSNGDFPDDKPLFYETVTGTIRTGVDVSRITLFIRGVKKFATGTEADFNIDDVSLVGPAPGVAAPAAAPPADERPLPQTGNQTLTSSLPIGSFAIGALILVSLGVAATAGLLNVKQKS